MERQNTIENTLMIYNDLSLKGKISVHSLCYAIQKYVRYFKEIISTDLQLYFFKTSRYSKN